MKKEKMLVRLLVALVIAVFFTLTSCSNKHSCQEGSSVNMETIDRPLLIFGDVVFGVNVCEDNIVFISSTQVDDPRIKRIVNYLNGKFGKANEEEPDNYWWYVDSQNNENYGSIIRLRPLSSEEGGTIIMFY